MRRPKSEDGVQRQKGEYCLKGKINKLLWGGGKPGRTVTLGLQHVFAMFGSTVLVPALTGLDASVTLFCMGVGTLIFHLATKGIVPAFMGSSFSFITAIGSVMTRTGGNAAMVGWGIMASGVLYLLLAGAVKLFGVKRITSFFPPVVTGCMIIIIGLMLAPTAMKNIVSAAENPVWKNWLVGGFTVLVIVLVMFCVRGFFKLIPILIGIVAGYLLSMALGMVDFRPVLEAKWFTLPEINFFAGGEIRWGDVLFAVTMIAPISVATFVEHIGDITANGAVTGKNYLEDPGLHRTLLGCGLATIFSGMMGGPAATTYSENTGVLAATKNYNPATLRIAAVFAIVLAFIGKVSGVLQSIPSPVMGGVSVILFGMIGSVGLRMLVENKVDFTRNRNLIIAGVMLVFGLGLSGGVQIGSTTISSTAIAAVLGIVLSKLLPEKDADERKAEKEKK